jgi:hypothetical protein
MSASIGGTCKDCRFFDGLGEFDGPATIDLSSEIGRCCRYPPNIPPDLSGRDISDECHQHPRVMDYFYCGEFQEAPQNAG